MNKKYQEGIDIVSYMLGKKAGGGGGTVTLQDKNISITSNGDTTVTYDDGYDGLNEVNINTNVQPNLESKEVTITTNTTTLIEPSQNKDGLSSVNVITNIPQPSGTIDITQNGTVDVTNYATADVQVPTSVVTEAEEKDVNFYTYDGFRTNSYTKTEFLELNAMPANPTYDLLTSQGWNWTLSDAKTYVTTYGGLDIGDIADSTDGALYIYINLSVEGRLSPTLVVNLMGTINIDWGDGNIEQGTHDSTATFWSIQHTYATTGRYRIKVSKANDNTYFNLREGTSTYGGNLISNGADSNATRAYYNSVITKIIMPSAFTLKIPNYSFSNFINLESLNIPKRITGIGNGCFNNCYKLKCINIYESLLTLGTDLFSYSGLQILCTKNSISQKMNAFSGCRLTKFWMGDYTGGAVGTYTNSYSNSMFKEVILPTTLTEIGQNSFASNNKLVRIKFMSNITKLWSSAFSGCYGLGIMDFSNNTQIPTLGSSALKGCPSDMKIIVPDDLYTSWIADSSWSTYSSQIVKASEA